MDNQSQNGYTVEIKDDDDDDDSVGLGEVILVHPTYCLVCDVFTNETIYVSSLTYRERMSELNTLHEYLLEGNFVEYEAKICINAQECRKEATRVQKILVKDIVCVNSVVKYLCEVDAINADALLACLNDTSRNMASSLYSKETLLEVIVKYGLIFDIHESMVSLRFEVEEDAAEWFLPLKLRDTSAQLLGDIQQHKLRRKIPLCVSDDFIKKCRKVRSILAEKFMSCSMTVHATVTQCVSSTVAFAQDERRDVLIIILLESLEPCIPSGYSHMADVSEIVQNGDRLVLQALPFPAKPDEQQLGVAWAVESVTHARHGNLNVASRVKTQNKSRACANQDLSRTANRVDENDANKKDNVDFSSKAMLQDESDISKEMDIFPLGLLGTETAMHKRGDEVGDLEKYQVSSDGLRPTAEKVLVPNVKLTQGILESYNSDDRSELAAPIAALHKQENVHQEVSPGDGNLQSESSILYQRDSVPELSDFSQNQEKVFELSASLPVHTKHVNLLPDIGVPLQPVASTEFPPEPIVSTKLCNEGIYNNGTLHNSETNPAGFTIHESQVFMQSVPAAVAFGYPLVQSGFGSGLNYLSHWQPGFASSIQPWQYSLSNVAQGLPFFPSPTHVHRQPVTEVEKSVERTRQSPFIRRSANTHCTVEGCGKVCAIVRSSLIVYMTSEHDVGVFTMSDDETQTNLPKLNSQVQYLACKVNSDQMRWMITDLFFENRIISASVLSSKPKTLDVAVQTNLIGHVLGFNYIKK